MKTLLAILLFGLVQTVLADAALLTLDLKHRRAEELIPLLTPLVGENGVVSGRGPVLFIRAETARLIELKQAVERLDTPARQLRISVYQGSDNDFQRLIGGKVKYHSTRKRQDSTQTLRVPEGRQAYIAVGRSIPLENVGGGQGPRGGRYGWHETTGYKDVQRGFYVTPWLRGDRVSLEISSFGDRKAKYGREINTRQAGTQVSGRLGEWMLVGSHVEDKQVAIRAPVVRRGTESREDWNVYVRVDAGDSK